MVLTFDKEKNEVCYVKINRFPVIKSYRTSLAKNDIVQILWKEHVESVTCTAQVSYVRQI